MSDNQMTAEQAKKNLKDAEGKPQKGEGRAKGGLPSASFRFFFACSAVI